MTADLKVWTAMILNLSSQILDNPTSSIPSKFALFQHPSLEPVEPIRYKSLIAFNTHHIHRCTDPPLKCPMLPPVNSCFSYCQSPPRSPHLLTVFIPTPHLLKNPDSTKSATFENIHRTTKANPSTLIPHNRVSLLQPLDQGGSSSHQNPISCHIS
jgi:hypothetical protein